MSIWELADGGGSGPDPGQVTARIQRSEREFIAVENLDACYPPDYTRRLILDNHSAHAYGFLEPHLVG